MLCLGREGVLGRFPLLRYGGGGRFSICPREGEREREREREREGKALQKEKGTMQ